MTQERDVEITALIPAYNEEKSIGRVIEDTRRYVQDVVVVDDGSSDGTVEAAISAGATVLRHRGTVDMDVRSLLDSPTSGTTERA